MKHVYGPVPSRRLGQSLGVDPVPFKTCNWNCIYCQLGRTTPMTNERRDYVPPDEIVSQVRTVLVTHDPGAIDWITFVGSGEPALHASLGRMIGSVKELSDLPVAVITNGSLLFMPDVREELLAADAVLPSLDAGSESLYRKINRPHPELSFDRIAAGLAAFRKMYPGRLWIEVMLIKDMNDNVAALSDLARTLRDIEPDEVHVSLPIRPPAETWVQPADEEGLMRATAILGEVARIVHPVQGEFDLKGYGSVIDAVIGVITRHPMREEELVRTLDFWTPGQVAQALAELSSSGRARTVTRYGHRFWAATEAKYAHNPP
jgi:wyosine [tRNA(Phe)-imidazoG37] synthetase (radical SAM superfamily)